MFSRNPEKLEAKAVQYEQRGKIQKAIKNREKAARLRQRQVGTTGISGVPVVPLYGSTPMMATTPLTTGVTSFGTPLTTANTMGTPISTMGTPINSGFSSTNTSYDYVPRTPARYEQNALKWEQRGNWNKAQKNREKVWRLQNPQYANVQQAPSFYNKNQFLGYNVPFQQQGMQQNQMFGQQGGAPIVHSMTTAPTVETHLHDTIVEQTTRMEKITEIQPVVHREIDAPQVRIIEKHMYESVPNSGPNMITRNAIVEETVRPRIIEEIQPVVHREVPQQFVEHVEQHVTEHVVLPTTQSRQVIQGGQGINQGLGGQQGFNQGLGGQGLNQGLGGQQGFNQGLGGQQGFNQGLGGQQGFNQGLGGQQGFNQGFSQFGQNQRDPALYEQRALQYERQGNQAKANKLRQKAQRIRQNNGNYTSPRSFADYDRNAAKWEKKNNFQKAQKNREKAWRLQNPQYMNTNTPAPSFYNNQKFMGYNQQPQQQFQAAGAPIQRI